MSHFLLTGFHRHELTLRLVFTHYNYVTFCSLFALGGWPCVLDGTRIASLIPCRNFLSAGAIVASAPRNFTRSPSTK